jgi:Winged helix-turn-helix domain (DUF2582)
MPNSGGGIKMNGAGAVEAAESDTMVQEEIGTVAGAIWRALAESGPGTLPKLRKAIDCKTPVFDWAIGWLARENKIAITREKKSFLVHLKETGS